MSKWKPNNKIKSKHDETNSSSILPKGCEDVFTKQLSDSVLRRITNENRNDTIDGCEALNTSVPTEYFGVWDPLMRYPYGSFGLTNWSAPWNYDQEGTCPEGDSSRVFNGSATENGFFSDSYSRFPIGELKTPIGNHSVYDYCVQRTTTLFFVTWPREGVAVEADVRSVSLSAQQKVEAGSRDPLRNAASSPLPMETLLWLAAVLAFMLNL